jgi:hypothetical protein
VLLCVFAFGLAAEVVGASGCVVGDLGDGDHVDGVVQLAVATWVQSLAFAVVAGRFDRCGAVVAGELGAGPEPSDVVNVTDDDGGDNRTDSMEFARRRARSDDGAAGCTDPQCCATSGELN